MANAQSDISCVILIYFVLNAVCVQDKIVFVCSVDCSQEFKRTKYVTSMCEHCKAKKIARDARRINCKDCFFCSDGKETLKCFSLCEVTKTIIHHQKVVYAVNVEVRPLYELACIRMFTHYSPFFLSGCKLLFQQELTKTWGKHCQSCVFCQSTSQKLVTAQYGGSTEEFCSDDCRSKYTMLFCHVRKICVQF